MGKVANISIEYYEDSFDLLEVYQFILESKSISFFDNNYFLVDFEPVYFDPTKSTKRNILDAIRKYSSRPVVFSLVIDGISTHHTLNAKYEREVNVAISNPVFLGKCQIPDFSFYCEKLLPYYLKYNIKSIECSYG